MNIADTFAEIDALTDEWCEAMTGRVELLRHKYQVTAVTLEGPGARDFVRLAELRAAVEQDLAGLPEFEARVKADVAARRLESIKLKCEVVDAVTRETWAKAEGARASYIGNSTLADEHGSFVDAINNLADAVRSIKG